MNDQELAQLARDTAKKAYAPYSNFRVGAALITDSGNRRPDYLKAFVDNMVNWEKVTENFLKNS